MCLRRVRPGSQPLAWALPVMLPVLLTRPPPLLFFSAESDFTHDAFCTSECRKEKDEREFYCYSEFGKSAKAEAKALRFEDAKCGTNAFSVRRQLRPSIVQLNNMALQLCDQLRVPSCPQLLMAWSMTLTCCVKACVSSL